LRQEIAVDELADFDKPIFKQISHNDSGASTGHQGGIVIPKDLDAYFPQLSGRVSAASPTVDEDIRAILVVGGKEVGTVTTRYQYQSWGGGRTVERRITGNLGPLRSQSVEDDIVVIERNLDDRSLYRITLLKKGSKAAKAVLAASSGKRWGTVDPLEPPVSEPELEQAEKDQKDHEKKPLSLFDNEAALVETHSKRVARSRAFQKLTSKYYGGQCALCNKGFVTAAGKSECEAAHIVPRGKKGADDARNGLALCRSHHWAFDEGLFGVDASGDILVPGSVLTLNPDLAPFNKKKLRLPSVASVKPSDEALAWHLKNVVKA
jgi:putative restriction endonuclease